MKDIPHDVPGLWEDYASYVRDRGIAAPRVVIHGGYGKRNMGDDAILHVLIERVRKHLPTARITVLCHGPENVRAWYPDVAACHFMSLTALKAIVKSHIYIIGGGGIINRINTYSGRRFLKILDMKGKFLFMAAWAAKLLGARTHFYAIGATSFPDAYVRLLARWVLRRADCVSVRDPLSGKNLRDIGVNRAIVQVLDPALSLEPAPTGEAVEILEAIGLSAKESRDRPLVGINIRYVRDPEIDNEHSIAETVRVVQYLVEQRHCDVLFLPISQHPSQHFEDDLDFGRQVSARLRDCGSFFVLETYHHPRVMMAILEQMDCLILMRLHAVILASVMNIPVIVASYDNKVSEFVTLTRNEEALLDIKNYSADAVIRLMKNRFPQPAECRPDGARG